MEDIIIKKREELRLYTNEATILHNKIGELLKVGGNALSSQLLPLSEQYKELMLKIIKLREDIYNEQKEYDDAFYK
jgi:hypothetical protein